MAAEERGEAALFEAAVRYLHYVVRAGDSRGHEREAVLVGPEVGDRGERGERLAARLGEQVGGCGCALLDGVGPVFDAHRGLRLGVGEGAQQGVGPAADIAGREDARGGAQVLIADYAVADRETRISQPIDGRAYADADDHGGRFDDVSVVEAQRFHALAAEPLDDAAAGAQIDACAAVQVGHEARELLAERGEHGGVERFNQRDFESARPRGGCDLCADEAAAYDGDRSACFKRGADRQGVGVGAERVDALEV